MKQTFLSLCVLFFFGFQSQGCFKKHQPSGKLNIVVSILPQKSFVEAIGGEHVQVKALIPPGSSPATFEPKPSTLADVENADIYFRVGHIPFEKSHAAKLAELNSEMKIVDTSATATLLYFKEHKEGHHQQGEDEEERHHEEEHGQDHKHTHRGIDPHVWLSPLQVKKAVDIIEENLSLLEPSKKTVFKKNASVYKQKLDELHKNIEAELKQLNTDKMLVFHPAWGYFAEEYGLEQIAIEQSGKAPTPKTLSKIIQIAEEEKIKVIFVQSQFNAEIAHSIAEQIGAVVVSIDPLSENYLESMSQVAAAIAKNMLR